MREESPSNLATLLYKSIERLQQCVDNACITQKEQLEVLNCVRLLTRLIPYIFEDPEWRGFFWSTTPVNNKKSTEYTDNQPSTSTKAKQEQEQQASLAQILLNTLTDLLFMPDFTANSCRKGPVEKPEDIHSLDSCEYIWEAGVGFAQHPPQSPTFDYNRVEIIKLLLTMFSEEMYMTATSKCIAVRR